MTLRRKVVDWTLSAMLIVIPAVVLRASLASSTPSGFDRAVLSVTAPLQAGMTWVTNLVGGWWSGYIALTDVEHENRQLRADNEQLRDKLASLSRRAADIEEVEALAALKQKSASDAVGARVIAAPMTAGFRVLRLRIDRGDKEVSAGMPVVSAGGPVGRVSRVFGSHADIELISDPSARTEVVISRTGGRGVMKGTGSGDSYACSIEWLERSSNPQAAAIVGDEVVTSGLGGTFPAGLLVGKVSKVAADNGMFQAVEITPVVDVSRVHSVLVLLAPPPPPDPDAKSKRKSEPAFESRAM
jgi:rod shape-determining protein MreC